MSIVVGAGFLILAEHGRQNSNQPQRAPRRSGHRLLRRSLLSVPAACQEEGGGVSIPGIQGQPPVKAAGICFSYGEKVILREVSLEVRAGETVGLVGPNGSGKTTFLRIVSGGLSPQRGEVYVDGRQLPSLRPKDRDRLVAMVPQNPAVPEGFTALQMVMMGRNPFLGLLQWEGPRDVEVCRRVMELTETWEFADRMVSSLSGGELQRVFIARALAQETRVLILDEPTAHLDISYQTATMDLIERGPKRDQRHGCLWPCMT